MLDWRVITVSSIRLKSDLIGLNPWNLITNQFVYFFQCPTQDDNLKCGYYVLKYMDSIFSSWNDIIRLVQGVRNKIMLYLFFHYLSNLCIYNFLTNFIVKRINILCRFSSMMTTTTQWRNSIQFVRNGWIIFKQTMKIPTKSNR